MFGIGLGVAILIDVLVVRMVVAPAVVTLLGDRAWWLPAWLDRLLPNVSLEGRRDIVLDEPEPEPELDIEPEPEKVLMSRGRGDLPPGREPATRRL